MSELAQVEIQDTWLVTAQELCDAFFSHGSVATLVRHRRYETRGRGTVVSGIKLSQEGSMVVATAGVVLVLPTRGKTVAEITRDLRGHVHHAWARTHSDARITIHIDVLGIES